MILNYEIIERLKNDILFYIRIYFNNLISKLFHWCIHGKKRVEKEDMSNRKARLGNNQYLQYQIDVFVSLIPFDYTHSREAKE